jgi:hypothetical protein
MQYWHEEKSTKANYMKQPESFQPIEKKGRCFRLSLGAFVGQNSAGLAHTVKLNKNNMLTHRFSIAPMTDWTGTSQKAKRDQRLSLGARNHAVPNAVAPSRRLLLS